MSRILQFSIGSRLPGILNQLCGEMFIIVASDFPQLSQTTKDAQSETDIRRIVITKRLFRDNHAALTRKNIQQELRKNIALYGSSTLRTNKGDEKRMGAFEM